MSMSPRLNAYLSLANALLFSSPWIKWIFLIGVGLACLGGVLIGIWQGPISMGLAACGGVFASVSVFMMMVVLPGQMLAVNSSKLMSILPYIKKISFHILFIFCFCSASCIAFFWQLVEKPATFVQVFLAVFFIASLMTTLSIVVIQRWQNFQFTMFFIIMSVKHIIAFFDSIGVSMVLGLNLLLWAAFYFWWQQWRPTRYLKTIVGMTQTEMIALQQMNRYSGSEGGNKLENVKKVFRRRENPIVNRVDVIRTHLMGANIGLVGRVQNVLLAVAFFVIFVAISLFFSGIEKTVSIFGKLSYVFVFIMYTSACQTVLISIYRNLSRIWLLHQGPRSAALSLIEKMYFSAALATALPIFIIHFILCFTLPQFFFDPLFSVMLLLFGMLFIPTFFYLGVIIYVYPSTGISWAHWVNIALGVLGVMAAFLAGFNWVEYRSHVISYALLVNVVIAIIVSGLRIYAVNIWPRVNFMRPVN